MNKLRHSNFLMWIGIGFILVGFTFLPCVLLLGTMYTITVGQGFTVFLFFGLILVIFSFLIPYLLDGAKHESI